MALTRTLRSTTMEANSPDISVTSPSFTPANGSFLVAFVVSLNGNGTANAPQITDTAGLTWTNRVSMDQNNFYAVHIEIWTAPVTTGVSMTVTADNGAAIVEASTNTLLAVFEFSGHDPTTPVRQVFEDGAAAARSGAYSGNFPGATLSTSYSLACCTTDNDAYSAALHTPGSGWTQLFEDGAGFNGFLLQERTGSTAQSVAYAELTAGYSWVVGAVEIAAGVSSAVQLNNAILVG